MSETEHTEENISYIRTHVDQIEQMTRFAIASNPNCRQFVEEYLLESKNAPRVYLALEHGPMNLDDLVKTVGLSKPQVSRVCTHLVTKGLITRVAAPESSRSFRYAWTDLEQLVSVSKIAKRIQKEKSK